jgi:hypothetical protein
MLEQFWQEQDGRCFYCDGATYLPSLENKEQARSRLHIAGGFGASRLLNQHVATVDRAARRMACKYCNCQRHNRSVEAHKRAMRDKVRADQHPVNRLVESYDDGRLSWAIPRTFQRTIQVDSAAR